MVTGPADASAVTARYACSEISSHASCGCNEFAANRDTEFFTIAARALGAKGSSSRAVISSPEISRTGTP